MSSDAVVIVRIRSQDSAQMHLAQDNDVVRTLTPDRSDQPFGKAILPGRRWCGGPVPDAHGAQSARDNAAIDPIAIPDHITRSSIPRKRFGYLTSNPLRRRVGCHVDPDDISAIKPYNDEAILGDRKPELKQLTVDARRAPKRVFDAHPPDQCAKVRIDLWSPSQRS